ncbi:hypothetical protein [Streptomyces sp. CA2R101]|uniref:hypothetical protein n=1 Tax=Streptomyces sp. CA2R101 TaxID=3120152 RepID=UPI0030084196
MAGFLREQGLAATEEVLAGFAGAPVGDAARRLVRGYGVRCDVTRTAARLDRDFTGCRLPAVPSVPTGPRTAVVASLEDVDLADFPFARPA